MSLYKRGSIWYYDFWFKGHRRNASTSQVTRSDAEQFERDIKRGLRRQLAGLEAPPAQAAPTFQDWAEIHYRERIRHITRPDFLEHSINVVLRFWGTRPSDGGVPEEPYHNLRLDDPIREPVWIERFEAWMRARGSSPQTRNHYRSTPARDVPNRAATGLPGEQWRLRQPVSRCRADSVSERTVTVSVEDLRKWLAAASYHVRLAVAIAALAPKLRLASVLALTWSDHIDAGTPSVRTRGARDCRAQPPSHLRRSRRRAVR